VAGVTQSDVLEKLRVLDKESVWWPHPVANIVYTVKEAVFELKSLVVITR